MPPSLFEQPIAANPMSEFVALPLDFIERSLMRKQERYEQAKANAYDIDNTLMQVNAVANDQPRLQQLMQGYDQEMDSIIESVDGDYGKVGGQLDNLKRQIMRDMNYGELGAIQNTYEKVGAYKQDIDKRYASGNVQDSGLSLANASIQGAITTQADNGSWSSFSGYQPSNIKDFRGELFKKANQINPKYDATGRKFVSAEMVGNNLMNTMLSNSGIKRAMEENYLASGSQGSFEEYSTGILGGIVGDVMYQQIMAQKAAAKTAKDTTGSAPTMIGARFNMPTSGISSGMKGGSSAWGKSILEFVGYNMFDDFEEWKNTEDAQRKIKEIEKKTGQTAPTENDELIAWVTDAYDKVYNQPVQYTPITDDEQASRYMNDNGLVGQPRVVDVEGNVIEDPNQLFAKNDEGKKGTVLGMVNASSGFPMGSILLGGTQGAQYIMEPTNRGLLSSDDYAVQFIESASNSPDNSRQFELKVSTMIKTGDNTSSGFLPAGKYESRVSGDGTYDIISLNTGEIVANYTQARTTATGIIPAELKRKESLYGR